MTGVKRNVVEATICFWAHPPLDPSEARTRGEMEVPRPRGVLLGRDRLCILCGDKGESLSGPSSLLQHIAHRLQEELDT